MKKLRTAVCFALVMGSVIILKAQEDYMNQWPQFRGPYASGILDEANLPLNWDIQSGENILWTRDIPGLGHSCPVVWGSRVFITTAISSNPASEFTISGREGNRGKSAEDVSRHTWRVICLDLRNGKTLWDKIAHEGIPKVKRHLKSSHANATPANESLGRSRSGRPAPRTISPPQPAVASAVLVR